VDGADPRTVLETLARARGADLSALSRLIGRNAAYIQQFIRRGTPRQLAEEDRRILARFFGVDEALLGAPPSLPARDDVVRVPRLDVGAAAGAGAIAGEERGVGTLGFSRRFLREAARGDPAALSIIRVAGDSMLPTLAAGDEILVDRGDAGEALRDGIYVLRVDGALIVKRLAVDAVRRRVAIVSDNKDYPSWPDCDPAELAVIGRVVWVGRRLG